MMYRRRPRPYWIGHFDLLATDLSGVPDRRSGRDAKKERAGGSLLLRLPTGGRASWSSRRADRVADAARTSCEACLPRVVRATMQTTAMRARRRAYSTSAAPRSLATEQGPQVGGAALLPVSNDVHVDHLPFWWAPVPGLPWLQETVSVRRADAPKWVVRLNPSMQLSIARLPGTRKGASRQLAPLVGARPGAGPGGGTQVPAALIDAADLRELVRCLLAQGGQGDDADHGDEGEEQGVLHESRSPLAARPNRARR